MEVEIGPVPSESARAWIAYAREVLDTLPDDASEVPSRARGAFDGYLEEWAAVADADETFRWTGDASTETVEYLVNALYRLGVRVEEDAARGRATLRPAAADKFHVVLVRSVLAALEQQGPAPAQFAEQLRAMWGPLAEQ